MNLTRTQRIRVWAIAVAAATLAGVVSRAPAQEADDEPTAAPEQALEAYLERLGLKRLLASELEKRLAATPKDVRVALAERLGKIYVDLLGSAQGTAERQMWEDKAKQLLADVPDADSFDLRLSLGKAVYVRAEEIAERHRLRLATPDEIAEAERIFRGLITQFGDIASKAHRRVDSLERVDQAGDATDQALTALADARRQRSLAFYFAGWSNYYLAMLSKQDQPAVDALRCFGWLLNSSSGRPASPDRVQPSMFQYEHVGRAAIGCALCASLRGNDTEALRWLDMVSDAEQTPEVVRDQVALRRVVVLGQAKRWADLELFIRHTRRADRQGGGPDLTPLPTAMARLLAVLTLEADKRNAAPLIEQLAKIALGDLVARKEVGQVLDLVAKYGTAPLGDSGFIVNYVRALQAYEAARKQEEAKGGPTDEPTKDAELANQYRAAAAMFQVADGQPDAGDFTAERARGATMRGRALFFSGDLLGSADAFTAAWNFSGKSAGGEEPLWLGILALERATKEPGAPDKTRERLNQTIALFLKAYPESDRAPRLTLMQISLGALGDEDALKVLSSVPKDSPAYDAARRQVARILYTRFRAARGPEKDFAAGRFIAVGEEVLTADRKIAMEAKGEEAKGAAERAILRARQLLDALLGVSTPDVARAETIFKILTGVASFGGIDLAPDMPELTFRELEIAAAKNDEDQVESAASRLMSFNESSAVYQAAGERLVYRHLIGKRKPGPIDTEQDAATARLIVKYGVRIIDRVGTDPRQIQEPGVLGVYSTVAETALEIARHGGDAAMRDLATKLDRAVLGVQPRNEASLRRVADESELAGDFKPAAAAWLTILESVPPGGSPWFEAKYQALRLLFKVEPDKARAAMREHKVLYPDGGPDPWGPKILDLALSMGESSRAPAAPPAPSAPGQKPAGGGGGTK